MSLTITGCSSSSDGISQISDTPVLANTGTIEADNPVSGETETDSVCPFNRIEVGLTGIERIDLLVYNFTELSLTDSYFTVDTSKPVASDDLLIVVSSNITISTQNSTEPQDLSSSDSSCGPPTSFLFSTDQIDDIVVTSDQDWNAVLPAGTPLNNISRVVSITETGATSDESPPFQVNAVDQAYFPVPADPSGLLTPLSELASVDPTAPIELFLHLSPPDATREHRINITYLMQSGDIFTMTTDPVTILQTSANPQRLNGSLWNLASYTQEGVTTTIDQPERKLWHRLSVGPSALQFVISFPELGYCEFNVKITGAVIEICSGVQTFENTNPSTQTSQNCNFPTAPSTNTQTALDQFFVPGQLSFEVLDRTLTLTSENGNRLVFESARI